MEGQGSNSYSSGEIPPVDQRNAGLREASINQQHDMNSAAGRSSPDLDQLNDEPIQVEEEVSNSGVRINIIDLDRISEYFPQPQLPQPNGIDQDSSTANLQPNETDIVNQSGVRRQTQNDIGARVVTSTYYINIGRQFVELLQSRLNSGVIRADITEVLDLQEEIGQVRTSTSERYILTHLTQRKHQPNEPGFPAPDEHCCICQEQYFAGEDITRLDCGHDYHVKCITQWLVYKNSCPICKATGVAALVRDH